MCQLRSWNILACGSAVRRILTLPPGLGGKLPWSIKISAAVPGASWQPTVPVTSQRLRSPSASRVCFPGPKPGASKVLDGGDWKAFPWLRLPQRELPGCLSAPDGEPCTADLSPTCSAPDLCSSLMLLSLPTFQACVYARIRSHFSHAQLCVTLWTVAQQAPLHRILQAKLLEWVAKPSSNLSS